MEVEECVGAIRRLPLAWSDPSGTRSSEAETLHMKEGRVALTGLRRAVAGTAGHGSLAATTFSVCVVVQLLCVLALMCRGSFDT